MSSTTLTLEIPLRWGDMDAYGHVNNVQIVRIMEEARGMAFGAPPSAGEVAPQVLAEAPLPVFATLPEGTQALVAENRVRYRAPLPYRALPARVQLQVEKVTPASLTVGYRIHDAATGTLCCEASTMLAFVHGPTGRLVRLSPEQRAVLEAHLPDA